MQPSHNLDPRIGIMMRGGQPVYYAFVQGYSNPETVGSLEEVELALGLRAPTAVTHSEKLPATQSSKRAVRSYEVTVTPRVLTYGSHGVNGEYTLTIDASSHAEALSRARQRRRDEEGRFAVPATFKARVLQD